MNNIDNNINMFTDNTEFFPAFDEGNVAVCIVCSNEYSKFAGVTIASIIENASEKYRYDIVVFSSDISEINRFKILAEVSDRSNIKIRFFNISSFVDGKHFYTWGGFNKYTYFRLLIPDVFVNYEKVLYLDSDIIVNHDIGELYDTNIDGYLLAAAIDTHVIGSLQNTEKRQQQFDYYMNVIGVKDLKSYYQCGVSLYNISVFRKTFSDGWLMKEAQSQRLLWMDQDFINIVAKGKIKTLDNRWNVMVINDWKDPDEQHLWLDLKEGYYSARANPYIIHFVGRSIPCFLPDSDFSRIYWQYAKCSSFYEDIICVMNTVKSEERRIKKKLMRFLVSKVFRPLLDFFFPKDSKRRIKLKKLYYKIRGWDCSAF